jgi:protein dithiol oxidoreductase (disulfide-forming)
MPMSRRALLLSTGGALVAVAAPLRQVRAQQPGTDYRTLEPPQPTGTPGKIEVIEFFSYACPHCAHFSPLVDAWDTKLPKDVVFRRVPVGFDRPQWINLQRAFYALQASGDSARLDGALFHAIHEEQQPLFDEQNLSAWVARNGGHGDQFSAAYVSFGVNNQTVQADKLASDYLIDSIPAMAVDGKYVALADPANGETAYLQQLLANTDKLIAKVRAERAGTAKPAKTAKPAANSK